MAMFDLLFSIIFASLILVLLTIRFLSDDLSNFCAEATENGEYCNCHYDES
jgi:hypothetical protein